MAFLGSLGRAPLEVGFARYKVLPGPAMFDNGYLRGDTASRNRLNAHNHDHPSLP